jgi:hypothetical protein
MPWDLFYSRLKHPTPLTLAQDQHENIATRMRQDGFAVHARSNGNRPDVDFEDCSLGRSMYLGGGEQQVDGSWTFSRPRLIVMKLKSRDGAPFTDGEKRSFASAVVAEMVLPDGWHVYERFRLG